MFKAIDDFTISVSSYTTIQNTVSDTNVGDVKASIESSLVGWIPMAGGTIGRTAGSYIGVEYYDLYILISQQIAGKTQIQADIDWNNDIGIGVPNVNGRTLIGVGSSGGPVHNLGEVGGEEAHTLIVNEIPSHTHTSNYRTTAGTGTGIVNSNGTQGSETFMNPSGGDLPHNNMQPFYTINYFIKF